jgi:hypothetical protein
MGCGASSSAKPVEFSPPARAAAAKARLEELNKPKSGQKAGQAAVDPSNLDNRAAFGVKSTPSVKKFALAEQFYQPHTSSVRACESACPCTHQFSEAFPHPDQDVFKYGRIVASHKAAISELFQKLSRESKGSVAKGVLKDLVAKYQGKEFDEKKFYGWYDVHGRSTEKGPGGSIDLSEFVSGLRIKPTNMCPGGCGLTLPWPAATQGLYLAELALAFGGESMAVEVAVRVLGLGLRLGIGIGIGLACCCSVCHSPLSRCTRAWPP